MNTKVLKIFKEDTVFLVAFILAVTSSIFVKPSIKYLEYIDFKVIFLLLSLMIVVSGLNSSGLFDIISNKILRFINTTRKLSFSLVFVCFFSSMLITNDVSLITFVPFSIMILEKIKKEKLLIIIIIMETIAANLGSMLTPLGNPQNLYLFSISNISIFSFLRLMLPVSLLSLILISIILLCIKNETFDIELDNLEDRKKDKKQLIVFSLLFILSTLTVFKILDYRLNILIVIIITYVINKKLILKADYMLLLTFIAFFIFIGNIQNIDIIAKFISELSKGNEFLISIFSSQFISNVPAAILISGFSDNYNAIITGTNIGGLGTLIASMASLISYKLYVKKQADKKNKFILHFTVINIIFLLILTIFSIII